MVLVFSGKTARRIRYRVLASYLVRAFLLDLSTGIKLWLISNTDTLVEFLPACCAQDKLKEEGRVANEKMLVFGFISLTTVLLESMLQVTTNSLATKRQIRVRYKHLNIVVEPLQRCGAEKFGVKNRKLVVWKCIPLLELICYDHG